VRASLVVRVPANSLEPVMAAASAEAVRTTRRSLRGEDVTTELVDLGAALANERALEARVRTLLDRAVDIEEALAVEQELGRIRGEIEQATARHQALSRQVELATLTVWLTEDADGPVQVMAWSATAHARRAAEALILGLQVAATVLIWVLIAVAPLVAVWVAPLWWWVRRRRASSV
jgi:hypothetical protein